MSKLILLTGPDNHYTQVRGSLLSLELNVDCNYFPDSELTQLEQFEIGLNIAKAVQSGKNVVVITHSEHIFNGIRVAIYRNQLDHNKVEFRFCSSNKDNDVVIRPDEDGRVNNYPNGFFDQLERELAMFLEPKVK